VKEGRDKPLPHGPRKKKIPKKRPEKKRLSKEAGKRKRIY